MSQRHAIVAGATGLVGREIVSLLARDDDYDTVTLLVRRRMDAPYEKCKVQVVNFAVPLALKGVDDVFIALGTTIKVAGSEAAFRAVDFDAVVNVAKSARAHGASRIAIVSALGASADSRVFYNRVKGEMEAAVQALGYEHVVIARPSLLAGNRAALGQVARPAERVSLMFASLAAPLIPKTYRAIEAARVAKALCTAIKQDAAFSVLENTALHAY